MKNKTLYFITGNSGKIETAKGYLEPLGFSVKNKNIELDELQVDTVEEVAIRKAKDAFEQLKHPLFVLDAGFCIPKMNGVPGPYAKYFIDKVGNKGILKLIDTFDPVERKAYYNMTIAYHDGEKIHTFSGKYHVQISKQICGTKKGWSPLWKISIPIGGKKTIAEYSNEERKSFDKTALENNYWEKFAEFLKVSKCQ